MYVTRLEASNVMILSKLCASRLDRHGEIGIKSPVGTWPETDTARNRNQEIRAFAADTTPTFSAARRAKVCFRHLQSERMSWLVTLDRWAVVVST